MTTHSGIELQHPGFALLDAREHAVTVPWEDDAVQLNVVVRDRIVTGPLMVAVGQGVVDFSRGPNQKFQIHDNVRSVGTPEQRGRTEILAGPVERFALYTSVPSQDLYRAEGEGLEIVNLPGFNRFLAFVFLGMWQQQNPGRSVAELTQIFDAYPEEL